MGRFTPTFEHTEEFDGDTIKLRLRRLKRAQMQVLAPHMKTDDAGETKMSFADTLALLEAAEKVLPEAVESMSGLLIDGREVAISDIVEETYFMPLLGNLLRTLFEASTVQGQEEKNSGALSPVPAPEAVQGVEG